MNEDWIVCDASERRVVFLAELLALALRPGDLVALSGDLGAGKSTFARALVRAALDDPGAEVPSPTFSLVQSYRTARFEIAHLDLYRLAGPHDLAELGIDEALSRGVALLEWPERAEQALPEPALTIVFSETDDPGVRDLAFAASEGFRDRLLRLAAIADFVQDAYAGVETLPTVRYLQGDASPRAYARLAADGQSAVLMDSPRRPDGPPVRDGLPYSRIARLAEDVRPFVAVARALSDAGLSVPTLIAHDMPRGLLLLEDLGDGVFAETLARGMPQATLWEAATDVLLDVRGIAVDQPLPLPDGSEHVVPPYDRAALTIETELLLDWLWPLVTGQPATDDLRAEFAAHWQRLFDRLLALPTGLVLRDYHSPNLMWQPERPGVRRVGVLDFQDAVQGHPAYDLVSLLQDARIDVPAELEQALYARYVAAATAHHTEFGADDFAFAYAVLGVQRNTKILGIFARLAMRDGKPRYLAHLPRIWGYLDRGLAHAALAPLAGWYQRHWPVARRGVPRWPT